MVPTPEETAAARQTRAQIKGACALLKCRPEQLLERIDDLLRRRDDLAAAVAKLEAVEPS